jgi:DNA-binding GntR family transcriptional regulator
MAVLKICQGGGARWSRLLQEDLLFDTLPLLGYNSRRVPPGYNLYPGLQPIARSCGAATTQLLFPAGFMVESVDSRAASKIIGTWIVSTWVDNASTDRDHDRQDRAPAQPHPGAERPALTLSGKPSTSERVYAALKREIMWGKIQPGTLLSETQLAARFGVSRTPVREALTVLASDGLITTLPWRGHLVRTVSFSEILEAFRLRELLEVEAAGQACLCITQRELAYLSELSRRRDNDGLVPDINRQFHMAIAHASGNRVLADFIERLLMMMQSVLLKDPHLASWTEDGMEAELAIIDALAARDEEAAREAMRSHIRNTLLAILRAIEVS